MVMISTCSQKQGMCLFYVPLAKKEVFYMGNKSTEEYGVQFVDESTIEKFFGFKWKDMSLPFIGSGGGGSKFSNVVKGIKKMLGISGKKTGNDEL